MREIATMILVEAGIAIMKAGETIMNGEGRGALKTTGRKPDIQEMGPL
jgi:hypothetical protein